MRGVHFIELPEFTRDLLAIADDATWQTFQLEFMKNPQAGAVIQDSGGLRKVRMKLPGRGKSAGARVIYLWLERASVVILFYFYTKARQSDLTPEQKKRLRTAVEMIRKQYESET